MARRRSTAQAPKAARRRVETEVDGAVAAYKTVLRDVLDLRPSGMRQRLAAAMGRNRSFISQLANPAYQTPIPVQHLETIFRICHFSDAERQAFLEAYSLAHPTRLEAYHEVGTRTLQIIVPDLGTQEKNAQLEVLVRDMARRIAKLIESK